MTVQERLDAANTAYHDLMTGKAVRVFVDQNGERIEYATANASKLKLYISDLERQVAGVDVSGPMRVLL